MAKFTVSTPDGAKYDIEAPEGATQEDVIQQVAQYHAANKELPRDYTLGETVSKGITRGAKQVSSSLFDVLPAMVGSAVGAKDYAARQMEEARQTQEEISQKYAPEFANAREKWLNDTVAIRATTRTPAANTSGYTITPSK
jgi:hypothetical protein